MAANRYGLSLADPDGLERWREKVEAQEQELRRERRTDSVAQLRAEIQAELTSLRAEMVAQQELQREAFGEVLGEFSASAESCTEKAIQRIQREFWTALERRFAELNARLDVSSGKPCSSEKFRSAGPVQDLPNPLSRRRGLN
jgi:hypothetical protein